jgi:hypothetical protein
LAYRSSRRSSGAHLVAGGAHCDGAPFPRITDCSWLSAFDSRWGSGTLFTGGIRQGHCMRPALSSGPMYEQRVIHRQPGQPRWLTASGTPVGQMDRVSQSWTVARRTSPIQPSERGAVFAA